MPGATLITPAGRRDGALDLLKWLALLSMVLDHLRYVGWQVDGLYVPGRLAFPWFCLAMAANLARVGVVRGEVVSVIDASFLREGGGRNRRRRGAGDWAPIPSPA